MRRVTTRRAVVTVADYHYVTPFFKKPRDGVTTHSGTITTVKD